MSINETKTTDISINELLRDSVLTIVQLRENAEIHSSDKLYELCKQHINKIKDTLDKHKYPDDVIDDICYAVCALLDETVLLLSQNNSRYNSFDYEQWYGEPLQVLFFHTNNAGNDLFEKISARLNEANANILVLQCFDIILNLGFQGKYLHRDQKEREGFIVALAQKLNKIESAVTDEVVIEKVVLSKNRTKSYLIVALICSIILAGSLYFVFQTNLNELLNNFPVE